MVINLEKDCERFLLSTEHIITDFDCGNVDLNDFFNSDAIEYKYQMLSRTYFFRHQDNGKVICTFSFSTSGIKTNDLPGSRRKKIKEHIPHEKSMKSYPAILIGRLGVAKEFNGQNIGSQLMDIIKNFCLNKFPDFVRFILVDAYNDPAVIGFYAKNDFIPVFSTEEQEKESYKQITALQTRYMFFDMIHWRNKMLGNVHN